MSTIQTNFGIGHAESGLNVGSIFQRETFESDFISSSVLVTTTPEAVNVGDIITPRQIYVKFLSGDPLSIGLSQSGAYPFNLSDPDEFITFRLDVDGLRSVSRIQTIADTSSYRLSGKYFEIYDRVTSGPVRVWFNNLGVKEISKVAVSTNCNGIGGSFFDVQGSGSVTYRIWINTGSNSSAPNNNGVTLIPVIAGTKEVSFITLTDVAPENASFDVYDKDGPVRFYLKVTNSLTNPPTQPVGGRLKAVPISGTLTKTAILTAFQSVVDADSEFSCSYNGVNDLTITSASSGDKEPSVVADYAIGSGNNTDYFTAFTQTAGSIFQSEVVNAIANTLNADSIFTATTENLSAVIITDSVIGDRNNITTTSGSFFNVSTLAQGAAASSSPGLGSIAPIAHRLIPVEFDIDDDAETMAGNIAVAMDEDPEFIATYSGNVVTIKNQHTGTRASTTMGDSLMNLANFTAGGNSPAIWLKSAGSSQLVIVVAPN